MSSDLICLTICACCTFLHIFIQIIISIFSGKKIDKFCNKCGHPVFKGEKHSCELSDFQINALVEFVNSIKGDNNGNDK